MSATWEEIKRLAADFQRVQLVESSYKLSERNCIEVINKLIEMGILNVYHTLDGKEYITEKQLEKEIYDELYVHEGRINIVKLQTLLNIDITHIESKVAEIAKSDPNLVLILGQLISKDYMNKIAEDINEMLREKDSVEISELTNLYELPTEFIQQILSPRIGTIIKGNFDGKILYTFNFVNNQKALLAGALEACIKPIRLSQIIKEYNLQAGIVFDIFDELIKNEQIKGTLFGCRQEMSAVFVPAIYVKAQQQYVQSFFKQNGYVEFSSLKKIGITEPESYVKSLFENQNIKYMQSSCFAEHFIDQIEQEIEDILNRNGFSDLSHLLPSTLNEKDLNKLTIFFMEKIKTNIDSFMMADTFLVNKSFLKTINAKFHEKMEKKAEEDLKKPTNVLAFRNGHAIIAGSQQQSTASGQQTNNKQSSKSKGKKPTSNLNENQGETFIEISFIDQTSLIKELKTIINDLPEELNEPLVEHFLKPLNHQYYDLLKSKIEIGLASTSKINAENGSSQQISSTKKSIKEVQEKVKLFFINSKIFEKANKSFTDPKMQDILSKHLIKTFYSEITNEMLKFLANEQIISFSEENFNNDSRNKIIQKLKDPHKNGFSEVQQAFTNKTSSEIAELIEKVATVSLELPSKKADPKKEKEVLLQMRESTKESLEKEKDPATVLHLTSILIYHQSTGLMLNAPGRCVPNILEAIKNDVQEETFEKLSHFQNAIIESLSKSKTDIEKNETFELSNEEVNEIRNIGLNAKKYLKQSQN